MTDEDVNFHHPVHSVEDIRSDLRAMMDSVRNKIIVGTSLKELELVGQAPKGLRAEEAAKSEGEVEYDIVCPHCNGLWDSAPHSEHVYEDGAECLCENADSEPGRGDCGGRFTLHRVPDGWRTEPLRWKCIPKTDAPNYGGWSEGDVIAYLSRFGEAEVSYDFEWQVSRAQLLHITISYGNDSLWYVQVSGDKQHAKQTLPEAMRLAVERWRELVAESDPMPDPVSYAQDNHVRRCTAHIGTGDLGERTAFGTGWHDPTEGK